MQPVETIAGICAGGGTSLLLHPLDLVKVRFQVSVAWGCGVCARCLPLRCDVTAAAANRLDR